jgi:hypothetical protein
MEKDLLLQFPDAAQASAFKAWFANTGLQQFKNSQQHLDIIDQVDELDMIDESCQIDCYNNKVQIMSVSDVEDAGIDDEDDDDGDIPGTGDDDGITEVDFEEESK